MSVFLAYRLESNIAVFTSKFIYKTGQYSATLKQTHKLAKIRLDYSRLNSCLTFTESFLQVALKQDVNSKDKHKTESVKQTICNLENVSCC